MKAILALFFVMVAACSNDGTRTIPSQLANDPCTGHDQASCTGSCEWIAVALPCAPDADCGATGVCVTPDPCRVHGDEASCAGAGCAWAGIAGLCPAGADCDGGGFCYTPSDDSCACACPAFCPPGEICPPCECDCTGGGTTCTCETPNCAPGETCPPSTCDCGGSGCSSEGTCTCACPACPPGEVCPPCDCTCNGGAAPTAPMTTTDPCTAHTDAAACSDDKTNDCSWLAVGAPCMVGQTCPSGVCQHLDSSGGGSGGSACGCVCPACAPGEACPPCDCGPVMSGGSGGGTGGGSATDPTKP